MENKPGAGSGFQPHDKALPFKGEEAIDTAVKMARQYQVDRGKRDKYKVISRWTSYHGNTLGALALSGHTGRRKYYMPLIQHTPHIVPAYCYRCPFDLEPETC